MTKILNMSHHRGQAEKSMLMITSNLKKKIDKTIIQATGDQKVKSAMDTFSHPLKSKSFKGRNKQYSLMWIRAHRLSTLVQPKIPTTVQSTREYRTYNVPPFLYRISVSKA